MRRDTIFATLLLSLLLAVSCTPYEAGPDRYPDDTATTTVTETVGDWLSVRPAGTLPAEGIVFYPGGLVEPEAYLPIAREISRKADALVVIVPMPLDLAVLSPQRGAKVPSSFPSVRTWFAAGHSLGGAMAAALVDRQSELFSGLILLAAYPPKGNDLSGSRIPVLSIFGEHDGLATADKIGAAKPLLPGNTEYVTIDGGNHAWFGNYGTQKEDGTATISAEEQWAVTADQIARFIEAVSLLSASSPPSAVPSP